LQLQLLAQLKERGETEIQYSTDIRQCNKRKEDTERQSYLNLLHISTSAIVPYGNRSEDNDESEHGEERDELHRG
jgi:hypothetical protein